MCCSTEPSEMSDTILSCLETKHPTTGSLIHVAGYQNKAESLAGPNAMLLPFPSRVLMGPENILDTREAKSLLKDYAEAIKEQTQSLGMKSLGGPMSFLDDDVQVFESGSYFVVLARNAAAIPGALRFVPSDQRPKVNQAIFDRYAEFYPEASWQLALCCWNGAVDAEPLLWWYEPADTSSLFFPALDAHDGRPPVLSNKVDVDHSLIVSSTIRGMKYGNPVYLTDKIPDALKPYVATSVAGAEFKHHHLQNGDWRFPLTNFDQIVYTDGNRKLFNRVPPPSA
jgi:hypothetical protein